MFERILVLFDGSKGSVEALAMAVKLAETCKVELLLLTVYRRHSMLEASLSMVRATEPEKMDDVPHVHGKKIVEQGRTEAQRMGAKRVRAFVRNGQAARGILGFAEENAADLIVLDSRGLGSVEHDLPSSVSHKVTGLAEMPVLVV